MDVVSYSKAKKAQEQAMKALERSNRTEQSLNNAIENKVQIEVSKKSPKNPNNNTFWMKEF